MTAQSSPPAGITALPQLPAAAELSGRIADGVRQLVEEAILAGTLEAGAHLNAGALAKQIGVSHIPVREALRSLAADGWIEHRPHLGAYVRPRSEHELADLFELRVSVESTSARLAAERRTAAQLAALVAVVDAQEVATAAVDLARINAEFHVEVAACTQNQWVSTVVTAISQRARFYFAAVAPRRRGESIREHRLIIDALTRRDGERAAALMEGHITDTWRDAAEQLRHSV
ncbi:MAG TPA: GntR family transcriptional regulator [Pseudonocardia sp.]